MRSLHRALIIFWLAAIAGFIFVGWNAWQTWLHNG